MSTTTAIGYRRALPVTDPDCLLTEDVPVPELRPHDLLVEVEAVSVNPVDVKLRAGAVPDGLRVLGFDAAGTVRAVGEAVTLFAVGDEVYYAGAINRPGTNQRLQAVDERLVGRKPTTLTMAQAAALPLTVITAWEALFDHLGRTSDSSGRLLIVGATGGVGIAMTQLAAALVPGVEVIATASGPERAELIRSLGAAHVVNHHGDLERQVRAIAPDGVDWLFTAYSEGQVALYGQIVAPFGRVVAIDDGSRDVAPLKSRAISWHWEFMFARSLHHACDMVAQHELLDAVAELVDAGRLHPVIEAELTPINVANLVRAHEAVETGHLAGKVVLHGW